MLDIRKKIAGGKLEHTVIQAVTLQRSRRGIEIPGGGRIGVHCALVCEIKGGVRNRAEERGIFFFYFMDSILYSVMIHGILKHVLCHIAAKVETVIIHKNQLS